MALNKLKLEMSGTLCHLVGPVPEAPLQWESVRHRAASSSPSSTSSSSSSRTAIPQPVFVRQQTTRTIGNELQANMTKRLLMMMTPESMAEIGHGLCLLLPALESDFVAVHVSHSEFDACCVALSQSVRLRASHLG